VLETIRVGNAIAGFVGYTLLSYSVLLVVASSLAVYRLARLGSGPINGIPKAAKG